MSEVLLPAPALVRLSFLVQSIYVQVCTGYDLPAAQAQLLCVLKDRAYGMSELTDMLRLEKSSVTGLVERAERRGLLKRAMSATDRRAVTVTLTGRGKRITTALYDEVTQRMLDLIADLPAADRNHFTRIASRIVLDESVPAIFGDAAAAS
jgi:DNA-binding MarR family transcriptional regulator